MPDPSVALLRRLAAIVAAGALVALFFLGGGYAWVTGDGNVEQLLTETGVIGPVAFVLMMWATQPFGVPGFVYMVPAGLVWPTALALSLAWVGNMGASYLAFVFARWIARDWVTARIPPPMHRFDDRIAAGGIWPIVLLRFAFGQLPPADWLLGVTKVTTRNFLIGTGIGIIPGVILFVVAGGGLLDYAADLSPATRRLLIIVAIGLLVARRVRRMRTVRRSRAQDRQPVTDRDRIDSDSPERS